jgi:hypothetical protein
MSIACTMYAIKRFYPLLDALAKLRTATVSFVIYICQSVRPHGATRLPLDRFSLKFESFRKSIEKIQVSIQRDKNYA